MSLSREPELLSSVDPLAYDLFTGDNTAVQDLMSSTQSQSVFREICGLGQGDLYNNMLLTYYVLKENGDDGKINLKKRIGKAREDLRDLFLRCKIKGKGELLSIKAREAVEIVQRNTRLNRIASLSERSERIKKLKQLLTVEENFLIISGGRPENESSEDCCIRGKYVIYEDDLNNVVENFEKILTKIGFVSSMEVAHLFSSIILMPRDKATSGNSVFRAEIFERIAEIFSADPKTYIADAEGAIEEMRLLNIAEVTDKSVESLEVSFRRGLEVLYYILEKNIPEDSSMSVIEYARSIFPDCEDILVDPGATSGLTMHNLMDVVSHPVNRPIDEKSWLRFSLARILTQMAHAANVVKAKYNRDELKSMHSSLINKLASNYPEITSENIDQVKSESLRNTILDLLADSKHEVEKCLEQGVETERVRVFLMQVRCPLSGRLIERIISVGPIKREMAVVVKILSKRVTNYEAEVTDFIRMRNLMPYDTPLGRVHDEIRLILSSLFLTFGANIKEDAPSSKDTFGQEEGAAEFSNPGFQYWKGYISNRTIDSNGKDALSYVEDQIIRGLAPGVKDDHDQYDRNKYRGLFRKHGVPLLDGINKKLFKDFVIDLINYVVGANKRSNWYEYLLIEILSNPVNRDVIESIYREDVGEVLSPKNQMEFYTFLNELIPFQERDMRNAEIMGFFNRIDELFEERGVDVDNQSLSYRKNLESKLRMELEGLINLVYGTAQKNSNPDWQETFKFKMDLIKKLFSTHAVNYFGLHGFIHSRCFNGDKVGFHGVSAPLRIKKDLDAVRDGFQRGRDTLAPHASRRRNLLNVMKQQLLREARYMDDIRLSSENYEAVEIRRFLSIFTADTVNSKGMLFRMLKDDHLGLKKILRNVVLDIEERIAKSDISGMIIANSARRNGDIFKRRQATDIYTEFDKGVKFLTELLQEVEEAESDLI